MSWRDLFHDAPGFQFVSDFSPCPLTDRAPGFHRRFARDGGNLAALLAGDPGWNSWSWHIVLALYDAERVQINALQPYPAITPQARRIHVNGQFACNLRIRVAL